MSLHAVRWDETLLIECMLGMAARRWPARPGPPSSGEPDGCRQVDTADVT